MYHCYFLINYIGPPKVFFLYFGPLFKKFPHHWYRGSAARPTVSAHFVEHNGAFCMDALSRSYNPFTARPLLQPCHRWYSNPQSQQAMGHRPPGHWDRRNIAPTHRKWKVILSPLKGLFSEIDFFNKKSKTLLLRPLISFFVRQPFLLSKSDDTFTNTRVMVSHREENEEHVALTSACIRRITAPSLL